ncbi:MAG: ABC transporter substrate-binding protein [Actinobacteria bacterium]|nr:ABC transporter substrate-binding protein [Actinomycetota bacterium]
MSTPRRLTASLALLVGAAITLSACAGQPAGESAPAETTPAAPATIQVEDNHGTQTVTVPPTSVVATDNRLFQTLEEWGVKLTAAPIPLIPGDLAYKTDASIADLGSHGEPDLEAVVAVEPDLIVNGQRFAQFYNDLKGLAPQAAIIELDPREGQPFDAELKRQVTVLGEVFGQQEKAAALVADFDASIARVKAAYDPGQKVMAVITSGGEINYAAPGNGRTLGPVFDILGLTPALSVDGSTDHQGDDISVEAIADSNPDWILVMDRDAGVGGSAADPNYKPANELLANSEALQNVTAVKEQRIVYMPQYTYVNEGIQTYTTFFNSFADVLEKA